jgi:hypothetical protein
MPDTSSSDMFAALEAQLDVELIEWEPTVEGERIVGLVKTIEYVPTKLGTPMPVLTLQTPSGAHARVVAGAKNLKGQLEAAKVQPGDGVAIQYEGRRSPKNGGHEYNAYRIAHQAVGPRTPGAAFKVPDAVPHDDLVPGAADPWQRPADDDTAPF